VPLEAAHIDRPPQTAQTGELIRLTAVIALIVGMVFAALNALGTGASPRYTHSRSERADTWPRDATGIAAPTPAL
jgi:hypothetical protein